MRRSRRIPWRARVRLRERYRRNRRHKSRSLRAGPAPQAGGANARPKFEPDNDFLFGTEDPQGLRCPLGAHIRRANPRESFNPGSQEQIAITNRHRIIRVGRRYVPEPDQRPGLFFMCLNGDIERQFEFVQQTWVGGSSFHGLSDERDPLVEDRAKPKLIRFPSPTVRCG